MNEHTLEDRYFERMSSPAGVSDKLRMLDHLPAHTAHVLDLGAASGVLSLAVAQKVGAQISALEPDETAFARLSDAIEAADQQSITAIQADSNAIARLAAPRSLDAVLCSSVLHEVFSYGKDTPLGSWGNWEHAIAQIADVLRPGGRLIIRDGVAPSSAAQRVSVTALTAHDALLVESYLEMRTHAQLPAALRRAADNTWVGPAQHVAEMVLTLNWIDAGSDLNHEQLAREVDETYMLDSLTGYAQRVAEISNHALRQVHAEQYTQPEYVAALSSRFALHDVTNAAVQPWFPATNALWVFEKVA